MNYSTKETIKQILVVRLHLVVVLSCVGLALVGQMPESSGGWLACPAVVVSLRPARGGGKEDQVHHQMWLSWTLVRVGARLASGRPAELAAGTAVAGQWAAEVGVADRVTVVDLAVAAQPLGMARTGVTAGMAADGVVAVARAAAGDDQLPGLAGRKLAARGEF